MNLLSKLGAFLTHINSIILFMTCFTLGMIFETQTMFFRAFPADMPLASKTFSSIFMAIGFEFTILIATLNAENKGWNSPPKILAVLVFIMNNFFFGTFQTNSISSNIISVSVSYIVAYISYVYSDLFMYKLNDKKGIVSQTENFNRLESDKLKLELELKEWIDKYNNARMQVNSVEQKLTKVELDFNEVEQKLRLAQVELLENKLKHSKSDKVKLEIKQELEAIQP